MTAVVERARVAFARQSWREAVSEFQSAPANELSCLDYEHFAIAAYLLGDDETSDQAWMNAQRAALAAGDPGTSARCSFWLALCLLLRGQMAQAGGWLARAHELIHETDGECVAAGYVLIPELLQALDRGEYGTALDLGQRAAALGNKFGDSDLRSFGLLGQGQALIAAGEIEEGTAKLDQVMVSVAAGEVGPITAGITYCAVIFECFTLFDLRRAAQWTDALSAWCDAQPELVPFRGQCLVHRSQLQQVSGDWSTAIVTAEEACRRLTNPPHPALGLAYYQQAELHRLTGAFDQAETEYRSAARNGHHPMPGLALLELGRGDVESASASIRRAVQEADSGVGRVPLLAAAVEIHRAAGDLPAARAAAEDLDAIAAPSASTVLDAMAAQAIGSVLIAEGETADGLARLRTAASVWQAMRTPYEAARVAVLLGLGCAAMGDRTSAVLELENARDVFAELGARPDMERAAVLLAGVTGDDAADSATRAISTLSEREREVLTHVAAGKTNREIAEALVISQHTVGRHLENIFAKLGVTTRTAATAYAYEHRLL